MTGSFIEAFQGLCPEADELYASGRYGEAFTRYREERDRYGFDRNRLAIKLMMAECTARMGYWSQTVVYLREAQTLNTELGGDTETRIAILDALYQAWRQLKEFGRAEEANTESRRLKSNLRMAVYS